MYELRTLYLPPWAELDRAIANQMETISHGPITVYRAGLKLTIEGRYPSCTSCGRPPTTNPTAGAPYCHTCRRMTWQESGR